MSRESIPLGPLCSECDQYNGCTQLCSYAEQYVNQDYVPMKEVMMDDMDSTMAVAHTDYKDVLHTHMRQIERENKLSSKDRAIIGMYLARVPVYEIAEYMQYKVRNVYKIIYKYTK